MKIKNIVVGQIYAVNYGSGIEPAKVLGFERPHLSRITGVMVDFNWRRNDGRHEYWVPANRVVELWSDRRTRLKAQLEEDERWIDEMRKAQDLLDTALAGRSIDVTTKLWMTRHTLTITLSEPSDVLWLAKIIE